MSIATMPKNMTIKGHLSDITFKVIGVVTDTLDTTIGEVDRVLALAVASTITGLSLIKAGSREAISNIVLEGVWDLLVVDNSTISSMSNDATMVTTDSS